MTRVKRFALGKKNTRVPSLGCFPPITASLGRTPCTCRFSELSSSTRGKRTGFAEGVVSSSWSGWGMCYVLGQGETPASCWPRSRSNRPLGLSQALPCEATFLCLSVIARPSLLWPFWRHTGLERPFTAPSPHMTSTPSTVPASLIQLGCPCLSPHSLRLEAGGAPTAVSTCLSAARGSGVQGQPRNGRAGDGGTFPRGLGAPRTPAQKQELIN